LQGAKGKNKEHQSIQNKQKTKEHLTLKIILPLNPRELKLGRSAVNDEIRRFRLRLAVT
jgi:hypothetical protein